MGEIKSFYSNSINYDNVSFADYFRTLTAEAKRVGLLDEDMFLDVKRSMADLLQASIASFTNYESTSIMRDTANEIFVSILYCLDVALFGCGSHENAVDYIKSNSTEAVFCDGIKLIKRCMIEAVSLLVKLKRSRINYPDKAYNTTVDSEIMEYMKKYDSKYFAHGTKRVFSYNPINGGGGHRGVLHLKKMIENLIFENKFVNSYRENTVQDICYGYCENNGIPYNEIGINIYSLVFLNAVFAEMAGNSGSLEVGRDDAAGISRLLKKLPEPQQKKIIYSSAEKISTDPYVTMSIVRLAGRTVNAVNNNDLGSVIYIGELK